MARPLVTSNEAQEFALRRGCFARVAAGGFALVFYTGDELQPGTWLEIGRTGMTYGGIVDQNAVERICSR